MVYHKNSINIYLGRAHEGGANQKNDLDVLSFRVHLNTVPNICIF